MREIILFLALLVYTTTFYGQKEPLRKTLKGENFVSVFFGNDAYLGGKPDIKLKTQLFEIQYEYFLSNKSSIGVFGNYGKRLTKNEENDTLKYSDYSIGLLFNQRITSGLLLYKEFYSYVGLKAGYKSITYIETNENIMLGGIHIGGKWFVGGKISLQLDLGGLIHSKEKGYGKLSFSPRIGIAYKL